MTLNSVCVNPTWVAYATEELKQSDVLICTVIGFPLGATRIGTSSGVKLVLGE